jgi:hypothetical protein
MYFGEGSERNGGEVDVNYNVSDRFMGTNLPLNEMKQSGLLLLYDYKKKHLNTDITSECMLS